MCEDWSFTRCIIAESPLDIDVAVNVAVVALVTLAALVALVARVTFVALFVTN